VLTEGGRTSHTADRPLGRSWFRYHQLFAGLLRLELRRAAPGEVAGLHRATAAWFAGHGYPAEAVRHAQATGDWELAAGLLTGHWPALHLDGQAAAVHELLAGFPAEARAVHAELAALAAADELARGSLEAAERYLTLAEQRSALVPEGRRGQYQVLLGIVRLLDARQRADPAAVADGAQRLQAAAEAPELAQPQLAQDLRALALISLGETEIWTNQMVKARGHLQQGIALARQAGRPFLEFAAQADLAIAEITRPASGTDGIEASFTRRAERARQAIKLAERHGWTDEPAFGVACRALGVTLAWQGRPEEAEPLVQHGERTATAEARPVAAVGVHYCRGLLELARRRDADALAAFEAAERLTQWLDATNVTGHRARLMPARAMRLSTLVRLGDTGRAEKILADFEEKSGKTGTCAWLRPHCCLPAIARAMRPPCSPRSWTIPRHQCGWNG
jgi:LuxR family transcriptional regulator, maltose regulon positive regulatory protein